MGTTGAIGLAMLIGGIVWTIAVILWSRRRKPEAPALDPAYARLDDTFAQLRAPGSIAQPEVEAAEVEAAEPEQQFVPCRNCGRPVSVEYRFCDGCGTPLHNQ
ncbi:MAG TPA: zinc ribbon domain-containing protein [Actinomycetota bacterium]|jgi:hypothetical protein|nr:zinc ribbon domain-containing protein [Actinomycetota bacterium]